MKVLCISKWAKAPSPEERDAILPKEVPATLKLYLAGVIEQMWFKLDAPGVVFLVNAESVDAAKAGPKIAALAAAAAEPTPDVPFVQIESAGVLLIYGRDARAIEAASLLKEHLDVTVLLTRPDQIIPAVRGLFALYHRREGAIHPQGQRVRRIFSTARRPRGHGCRFRRPEFFPY